MACLDPKYRIVIQCQSIGYVVYGIVQPKLRVFKGLTDRNDYNINKTQSDIIEDLIQVKTDEIVLNESANQPEKPNQILENNQNDKCEPNKSSD